MRPKDDITSNTTKLKALANMAFVTPLLVGGSLRAKIANQAKTNTQEITNRLAAIYFIHSGDLKFFGVTFTINISSQPRTLANAVFSHLNGAINSKPIDEAMNNHNIPVACLVNGWVTMSYTATTASLFWGLTWPAISLPPMLTNNRTTSIVIVEIMDIVRSSLLFLLVNNRASTIASTNITLRIMGRVFIVLR